MRYIKLLVLTTLLLFISVGTEVNAESGVRYNTFTTSKDEYVRTQTAYISLTTMDDIYGESLDTPNDIFIDESNNVYIASTNNSGGKIIKFNLESDIVEVFGEDFLINPTGIYVNEFGDMYVADKTGQIAYRLDSNGVELQRYTLPTSPIFGFDEFQPRKIVSDKSGNVYILNNGSKGLVQYRDTESGEGEFRGYFGTNYIAPSFRTVLQYTFFTDEQRESLFKISPPEISNVAIDDRGLIHTVSLGVEEYGVKRLSISGDNLLPAMKNELDLIDVYVGPIGNIYTITESGWISEYDIEGNLLFTFGGQDESNQIKGLFNIPSAIAADENYNLYVLDRTNQEIQIFIPTEFAGLVHEALLYYQEGLYIESKGPWEEVLKMNDLFDLAHKGLGNAYYSLGEYENALDEYEISSDHYGYSDAYWEVRNTWLIDNVGNILIGIFSLLFIYVVNIKLRFMKYIMNPIKKFIEKVRSKSKLIDEVLYVFSYLKNPADASYYIKRKDRVSMFSATVLMVLYFVFYIYSIYGKGFLFNYVELSNVNMFEEAVKIFLPLGLFVAANYLVSSIRDGEGRFRDVYVVSVFSLTPYFIILPFTTILTNYLTFNEAFLLSFIQNIGFGVTLIYVFFSVKENHNYGIKETIQSIFISVFTMVMMLLSSFIIFILLNELVTLIKDIILEVFVRG